MNRLIKEKKKDCRLIFTLYAVLIIWAVVKKIQHIIDRGSLNTDYIGIILLLIFGIHLWCALFLVAANSEIEPIKEVIQLASEKELQEIEKYIDHLCTEHKRDMQLIECLISDERIFCWNTSVTKVDIYQIKDITQIYNDDREFLYIMLSDGSTHKIGSYYMKGSRYHKEMYPCLKMNNALKTKIEQKMKDSYKLEKKYVRDYSYDFTTKY